MTPHRPVAPRTLLFDLDGVLVDSRTAIARSINHALDRVGRAQRPEPELHRFIGPPLQHAFAALVGDDAALVDRCVAAYRERYAEASLRETTLHPGIAETLARLASRARLAVVTSKPEAFAGPILAALGIRDHFEAVAGPSLAARGEPKTETLARALGALGLGPGDRGAAVVGDRHHDVEAAHAHGLLAIGVTWGIGDEAELRAAGADRIVHTPAELD